MPVPLAINPATLLARLATLRVAAHTGALTLPVHLATNPGTLLARLPTQILHFQQASRASEEAHKD